jgi:glycolate oxidase
MELIDALKKISGDHSRVLGAAEIEDKFLSDALEHRKGSADALFFALSTEEVSRVLAYAHEHRIPVTPRGAGTNLTGATVPLTGGIVLDLSRMNRLLEIDRDTLSATVEPGILLEDFQKQVEGEGLFYPPDPGEKTSSIGGNISTNAGGMRAVKYGVTRDYVRSLELVKADGTILTLGSKNVKDASGLSLKNIIIGSEGVLAVITKCVLRLLPLPKHTVGVLIGFAGLEAGIQAVSKIIMTGTDPVGLEFIERSVVDLGETYTGLKFPGSLAAKAFIILSYDGESPESIDHRIAIAKTAALGAGAVEFLRLDDKDLQLRVWQIRGCLVKAVEAVCEQEPLDIVAPINRISEFVACVHELEAEFGFRAVVFGHAGDGNVHLCILREDRDDERWEKELDAFLVALYRRISAMGGLVSGEHGIGISKQPYFLEHTPRGNLDLMNEIKKVFDPRNILNPGKVFEPLGR